MVLWMIIFSHRTIKMIGGAGFSLTADRRPLKTEPTPSPPVYVFKTLQLIIW
jgi:hypothetical protein